VAFRYRFWPDQNRKIIRSKNVTFNENALYKNDSSAEPARIEFEAEKPEFINLDGIPKGPATHRMNSDAEEGLEVDDTANQQIEQGTPVLAVRRSLINIRPPQRYSPSLSHILLTNGDEPETFVEALQVEDTIKWELAMKDEMYSLLSNQTWALTELPVGKKILYNKWVYRIKGEYNGSKRYKAGLTVKWIVQYLRGTSDISLCFTGADLTLQGYVDAYLAGTIDRRKGTAGFVINLGGIAVSWASKLQKSVTIEKLKLCAASVGPQA
jgi:hypothetical protein